MLQSIAKALVIAPHCDDLEIGCGGLVAKLTRQGVAVTELVMAVGELAQGHRIAAGLGLTSQTLRLQEAEAAADLLGVKDVRWAFTEESRLDTVEMAKGTGVVQAALDELQPDLLLVNLPSSHQDHRWVHDCTVAALRPWRTGHHPRLVLGYEYPLLYWGGYDAIDRPVYVDITEVMQAKQQAVAVYASQLRPGALSAEAVDTFSRLRGHEAGVAFAERYSVLRMVL